MTLKERETAANAELRKIGLWLNNERKKIYFELDVKLGTNRKFEGDNEAYKKMYEELAGRCLEVQKKYNLPIETKLKLW